MLTKKREGLHGEESEEGVMKVVITQRTTQSRNIQKRLNLTLEVSDDGNDDDGLWKPMITKLSENPTKQEKRLLMNPPGSFHAKQNKKLGGIIKTRYENGNQEIKKIIQKDI